MNRTEPETSARAELRRPAVLTARRTLPRTGGLCLSVAGFVGVLALLLTPWSAAAGMQPATTFTAPYHGKAIVSSTFQTLGCGVKGTFVQHPKFVTSTGVGSVSLRTHAKSCPSGLGYNWVDMGGGVGYFSKPFTGVSGVHHVVSSWNVNWVSHLSASRGPKLSGSAYATSYVVATLWLLDESNLTYLPAANGWSWFGYDSNGTSVYNGSSSVAIYLNQTLNSADTYAIEATITAYSKSWASSAGPSVAAGSTVLTGTSGSATRLTSLTLS